MTILDAGIIGFLYVMWPVIALTLGGIIALIVTLVVVFRVSRKRAAKQEAQAKEDF